MPRYMEYSTTCSIHSIRACIHTHMHTNINTITHGTWHMSSTVYPSALELENLRTRTRAHARTRSVFHSISTVLSFSHSRGRRHENHPSPSILSSHTHTHRHEGPECVRCPWRWHAHTRACVRVCTYDVIDFMLSERAVRRCCCAVHGPSSLFGALRAASPRGPRSVFAFQRFANDRAFNRASARRHVRPGQ